MDALKNTRRVAQNVIVPEAQDCVAGCSDCIIAGGVALCAVLATIGFNDQHGVSTGEVGIVGSDGILTDEFETEQPTVSEMMPETSLSVGHLLA